MDTRRLAVERQYNEPAITGTRRTTRQELPGRRSRFLMLGCTACDTFTLRVYAHVIRKHADEVANTFAAAVDGDTEAAATDPDEDDPEDPVQVAC